MEPRPFTDHSFQAYLREGKLMGSRCLACQAVFVPPRALCPQCDQSNMEWELMEGRGKLVAFTCIAIGTPAMLKLGYGRENPYCTGVVELEEKARVVARIEGVDTRNPGTISVGMPLQVDFLQEDSGSGSRTVLAFKPLHAG
ncbi:MAG: Zn-ribbon domain-containing OB-fold protein [Acidobacteriota bacterium]|nr:Zn-ribbon domain-containing OB-fold protein [Acidobacteriota bacterium]